MNATTCSNRKSTTWAWIASALLATATLPAQNDPARTPINTVIGDSSFELAFGTDPAVADQTLRIRTHLAHVAQLLRQRDVSDLPAELQAARAQNIEHLHTYVENGVFPRNYDHPDERRPCFIDNDGRICAVGYLVEQSAGRELAEAINGRFQYELLADMKDERLTAWAEQSGLTVRELETIQPTYGPSPAHASITGSSCATPITVAPYVVADPSMQYGLYGGWTSGWVPFWWVTPPANAEWIGSAQTLDGSTYTVTKTFDLTGLNAATATISGEWSANPNSRILLNGSPTGVVLPAGGWSATVPFTINTGFVAGVNTIEFELPTINDGFFGVLVANLAGTAQENQQTVAIPGLFNTGVDQQGIVLQSGMDPHYRSNEPPLRTIGRPISPNPNFGYTLEAGPNRMVLLGLSFAQANVPIGAGCTVLIDPNMLVTSFALTDAQGMASFSTPVPPGLLSWWGYQPAFHAQGIVEDPGSPLSGLSLTQGLFLYVGS